MHFFLILCHMDFKNIFTWICFLCIQAFQKDDIEPLQTQLHDINLIGQSLIQNAAKGTSTKKLEDDLEDVNLKWNTLNKKVGMVHVQA